MKIKRFLGILNAAVLQMSACQSVNGIHDRQAIVRERQDELLKWIARFLPEDDEMRKDVAEMVD
ncbi:hypothetical protein RRF57_005016 [Xylaria bambusicola]|uniref:Uncharacterized protein n=1 Tax=Xylaria bambusicola TaxID=326684 RepID=A0AAN7Z917_9PEZI